MNPNSPYDPDRPILGGTSSTDGYVAPERLLNSDNAPTQWRLTFGLNWFPTNSPTLRLSANYQHNREAEDIVTPEGTLIGVRNDRLMFQITAGL